MKYRCNNFKSINRTINVPKNNTLNNTVKLSSFTGYFKLIKSAIAFYQAPLSEFISQPPFCLTCDKLQARRLRSFAIFCYKKSKNILI
ncbi:MAG: hypothetical protein LBP59_13900 [Planctomycetaceae bacterium]|nr:hypothetical protein [Planctomycetaceae bacterium]